MVVPFEHDLRNVQDVEHSCTIETDRINEFGDVKYRVFVRDNSGQSKSLRIAESPHIMYSR